ncbi:hypothetical protein I547_1512 [Mycobacterium kansasii 824]|uniref:Uncharacterized protein n=1 Tax=Mycobacterium kansasii TaxID=1768 RepID=A0A1V3WIY8_MYCKA|nr:hypothetical protein I547_1512 [Mycobacterium kansasii 824]OOK66947.1 hypothetical protein BZL29_7113 [Mycobacterium kansasii]
MGAHSTSSGPAAYAVLADLAGDAIVVADPPKTVGHRAIG